MGTPGFAVPSLKALASCHEVYLVVTQPDRPSGRGRKVQPPPVKTEALSRGLHVLQTDDPNHPDMLAQIQEMRPQVIAVVAYGCILKKTLLDTPSIGPINLHASLLPKYRGVSPINRAIMDGEIYTGVTTIRMDEGIDTGPILLQKRVGIGPEQTAGELSEGLSQAGAKLLLETVDRLEEGGLIERPQDDSKATYARKLKKVDGIVTWERPAGEIVNHVRGVTPWPGARTHLDGQALKIIKAAEVDCAGSLPSAGDDAAERAVGSAGGGDPGTVLAVSDRGPLVAAADGCVVLETVCPEGKKPMSGASWARGRRDLVGLRFSLNV